jgi:hypothetical protein
LTIFGKDRKSQYAAAAAGTAAARPSTVDKAPSTGDNCVKSATNLTLTIMPAAEAEPRLLNPLQAARDAHLAQFQWCACLRLLH